MPVESSEDRAAFYNPDEFGITATYTPAGGASFDLDGMFIDADETINFGETGVSTGIPEFHCRTEDLPAGSDEDDTILIDGVTYRVAEAIQDDKTGMTVVKVEVSS